MPTNDAVHASSTAALLARRWPVHASLSPDGAQLLATTTTVPHGADESVLELSLIDVATGVSTAPLWARPGDAAAHWSPDGTRVLVHVEHDGDDRLVVVDVRTGERQLVDGATGVAGSPAWSPDGARLVVPCRRGVAVDRSRPFRWTRPFLAFDATGALDDPPQLRVVDLASGEGTWVTDDDWRWGHVRWAPTGDRLAAVVSLDPTGASHGQRLRLVGLDPAQGEPVEPAVPSGRTVVPCWMPDGRLAVLVAEPRDRPGGSAGRLYVVDGERGEHVQHVPVDPARAGWLLGDVYGDQPAELADSYDHVVLAHHDGSLIVRTGARGRMSVVQLRLEEGGVGVEVLANGDRCVSPVALAGDTLIVTTQSATTMPELAVVDVARAAERALTAFGADPTVEVLRFTVPPPDPQGDVLDGWFLRPIGASGPLPTVLVVHGGPHFTYGEAFSLDAHALCAAGFGVVMTNPRGSTGYGDRFAHAVHHDWAFGPSRDIHAVLDHVEQEGWIDPRRLGITGNSYGGYMSAWQASVSERFRAAVIENPVTDLVSMWATSDIGLLFFAAQMGGPPHERLADYAEQSPLLRAHECRTPCLFVVGEADKRCPPFQAWAMHRVLTSVGTPSEVLVLPDSPHEGSTYGPPPGRLAHDAALVAWMQRWLGEPQPADLVRAELVDDPTIDITTVGCRSGEPRRIEIWMLHIDGRFFITGTTGRRDWVANLQADPQLVVHLKRHAHADLPALATPVVDDATRRTVLEHPSATWYREQQPLDELLRSAPMVEISFPVPPSQ
jgi:dipeptidyl aminopeptidase/acylaminoacyl peptidase